MVIELENPNCRGNLIYSLIDCYWYYYCCYSLVNCVFIFVCSMVLMLSWSFLIGIHRTFVFYLCLQHQSSTYRSCFWFLLWNLFRVSILCNLNSIHRIPSWWVLTMIDYLWFWSNLQQLNSPRLWQPMQASCLDQSHCFNAPHQGIWKAP